MIKQRRVHPDTVRLLPKPDCDRRKIHGSDRPAAGRDGDRGGPAKTIRVVVAGGRGLARAGYRALLESEERIEVIGEAAGGREALAQAAGTRPDVVLLDAGLPGLDVVETVAAIASQAIGSAVILIVPRDCEEWVFRALEAGAAGVLRNDAHTDELIRAVHVVAHGDALLSMGTMRKLLAERHVKPIDSRSRPSPLEELTAREREVMALAAGGLRNGEIAAQLVISPKTAKTHISRAMVKLGAHDRAQLVILAYETGLVPGRCEQPSAEPDPPRMRASGTAAVG